MDQEKKDISAEDRKHNRAVHIKICKEQISDQATRYREILNLARKVAGYMVAVVGAAAPFVDLRSPDMVMQVLLSCLVAVSMAGSYFLWKIFRGCKWSPGPEVLCSAEACHTLSQEEYDKRVVDAYTEAAAGNWPAIHRTTSYLNYLIIAAGLLTVVVIDIWIYTGFFQESATCCDAFWWRSL